MDPDTQYDSFYSSGLYDPEYLKIRYEYLFRGEQYRSIQLSVTQSAFPRPPGDWKEAALHGIDFTDLIGVDQVYEYFYGGFILRCIKYFFNFLSYLGGAYALLNLLLLLVQRQKRQRRSNSVNVHLDARRWTNRDERNNDFLPSCPEDVENVPPPAYCES